MPKFNLSADVTVSAYTTVEAATLEEAIKIAEGRDAVIGGMNSGEDPRESWIIEDADGVPKNIRIDD